MGNCYLPKLAERTGNTEENGRNQEKCYDRQATSAIKNVQPEDNKRVPFEFCSNEPEYNSRNPGKGDVPSPQSLTPTMHSVAARESDANGHSRTDTDQTRVTRKSTNQPCTPATQNQPKKAKIEKEKRPGAPDCKRTELKERRIGENRAQIVLDDNSVVSHVCHSKQLALEMTTSTMQSQPQEKAKHTQKATLPKQALCEDASATEGHHRDGNDLHRKEEETAMNAPQAALPKQLGGEDASVEVDYSSDSDIYRTEEDIEQERQEKDKSHSAMQPLVSVAENQCSVEEAVDLLSYSEREWRGNTAKSVLIRKGYSMLSKQYSRVRRVRGDNYCALRATLFQLLSQTNCLPTWLQSHDFTKWPVELQSEAGVVGQWRFPFENRESRPTGGTLEQLAHCLDQLKKRWQEAVGCGSDAAGREPLCRAVFQGRGEEYQLLEALKFLMLRTAVRLHADMERGASIPEFGWLLFARDSSPNPGALFTNHLKHVGFTGGLEQVEMFLLGYTLEHTIQVYRLYKADTEEFTTFYPSDHTEDWPHLSLVTEDDRHYNVLVPIPTNQSAKFDKSGKPLWRPSGGQTQQWQSTYL